MRRIRYRIKRNRGVWGLAFPHEWRIELDPSLDDKTLLDIGAHEALHLMFPRASEEKINECGKQLADLFWRLGFRREHEDI